MIMEFVNLTPHSITIYLPDGTTREIPASGQVARLVDPSGPRQISPIGDMPAALYSPLDGRRLDGLPEPRTGVVYITSILCLPTAQALGRYDVAAPDTDTGAVRTPVTTVSGKRTGGDLLGTTRLLYAGDPVPAYRLVTGSATHGHGTPRDLDILGWADAPIGREHRVIVGSIPMSLDAESVYWRCAIDYHEVRPVLGRDGAWEIRVPVWAEEDPSRPTLLWHSPCARTVRVVRDVLTTGPAQIRRYAATGVMPDFDGPGLADHGQSGHLVVEMTAGSDDIGYRGCGLLAWQRAFARLSVAELRALPDHVQEFAEALLGRWDGVTRRAPDLHAVATAAAMDVHAPSPRGDTRTRDANGAPGSSGIVTYYWDHTRAQWTTPYAYASGSGVYGYDTFADVLGVWS
jgi:hypothetical protein